MYSTMSSIQNNKLNSNVSNPIESFSRSPQVYRSGTVVGTNINNIDKRVGPKLWGRPFWFVLHFGALNYPDSPAKDIIEMSVGFILGIPVMLPCDICKNHAYEYIQKRRNRLYKIASNKESLFKFYWEFHNDVNKQNGKRQLSLSEVYDIFQNRPQDAL
jgi:hypothetical protein